MVRVTQLVIVVAFLCSVIAGTTLNAAEHVDLPGVTDVHAGPDAESYEASGVDLTGLADAVSPTFDVADDVVAPDSLLKPAADRPSVPGDERPPPSGRGPPAS